MSEEELKLKIKSAADVSGFEQIRSKFAELKQQIASADFKGVGLAVAGGAAAGLIGIQALQNGVGALKDSVTSSINVAASFQQEVAEMGAVSNATADQMEMARQKALQLGADTAFSASEAASAFTELVKAGVPFEAAMAGAADATVALAAAGGVSLPEAAAQAAAAMNNFGMSAEDLPRVADLIAGAANASAIDVGQFGQSLNQAGAVASMVGLSFDDLALAVTAMGQAGIAGSDAGTSLKTFLLNLQPNTDKAAAKFMELGLITKEGGNQFFDASGKIKDMAEIADVLSGALAGMTEQQKTANLAALFGTDAIRAASVVAREGADGIAAYAEQLDGISAADVAARRLDTFQGVVDALRGSIETVQIKLGDALLPMLRGIAESFTTLVNKASPVIDVVSSLGARFGDELAIGIGAVALAITIALVPAMASATVAAAPWLLIGAAIVAGLIAIGAAVKWMVDKVRDWLTNSEQGQAAMEAWRAGVERMREAWLNIKVVVLTVWSFFMDFVNWCREQLAPVWDAIRGAFDAAWEYIKARGRDAVDALVSFWEYLKERARDTIDLIVDYFRALPEFWSSVIDRAREFRDGVVEAWGDLQDRVGEAIDRGKEALRDWVEEHRGVVAAIILLLALLTAPIWLPIAAIVAVKAAWENNWGGIQDKVQEAKDAISGAITSLREHLGSMFGGMREDMVQVEEQTAETGAAISERWAEVRDRVGEALSGLWARMVEVWSNIRAAVSGAVQSLISWLQARWHAFAGWLGSVQRAIASAFSTVWAWIRDTVGGLAYSLIGAVSGAFVALWNWLRDTFLNPLADMFSRAWRTVVSIWAMASDAIVSGFVGAMEAVARVVQRIMTGVSEFFARAISSIVNRLVGLVSSIASHIPGLSGVLASLRNAASGGGEGGGLLAGITATLQGWIDRARQAAVGIRDAFMARFNEIKDRISQKIDEIRDKFAGGGDPMEVPIDTGMPEPSEIEALRDDVEELQEEQEDIENRQRAVREARTRQRQDVNDEIRQAQEAIRAQQELAEQYENRMHELIIRYLEDEMAVRESIHDQAIAALEVMRAQVEAAHEHRLRLLNDEKKAHQQAIDDMAENVDRMGRELSRLKLDLNVEAENAKLDALEERLGRYADLFKELERVESDPRKAREAEMKRQSEMVRLATDEQRRLLQDALDQGLVSPEDRRTVDLLMAGYKARAVDVERIMAGINSQLQGQVDGQQSVIDQKNAQIAAAERELELARQLAAEEKARIEALIEDVDARIEAENQRFSFEMGHVNAMIEAENQRWENERDQIQAAIDAEKARHEERMRQIEEQYALELLRLEFTEAEIQAILDEQMATAARIADEARRRYSEAMDTVVDVGVQAAVDVEAAWERAGNVMLVAAQRWAETVIRTVERVGAAVGVIGEAWTEGETGTPSGMGAWRDLRGSGTERAKWDPSMRQNMFAGKRGSGGWRAGHDWWDWHYGGQDSGVPEYVRIGGGTPGETGDIGGPGQPGGTPIPTMPVSVTMGDMNLVGMTVRVNVGAKEVASEVVDALIEDVQILDKLGARLNEREQHNLGVGGSTS